MNSTVSFEVISGKKIFQIFTDPDQSRKKIVIMSHGFRGSSIGPARTFVDFERILLANGFSCLRFDQPCSGNSEGDYLSSSFTEWVATIHFLAQKYLDLGYSVSLLGQSMGATATIIAAAKDDLKDKIPFVLLWVPDPKSTFVSRGDIVVEENGQMYSESFWLEAKQADFFQSLKKFPGGIHLVYGENDRYISQELRGQVLAEVERKGQPYLILAGQDHSPWSFETAQKVFLEELGFLKKRV